VNPQAGKGLAGEKWPFIRDKAFQRLTSFQTFFTSGPGNATRLTQQQLQEGARTIICVGGDGTFNEVVNGFMDGNASLWKEARVALLPAGTGCDFSRTVRIPADLDDFFDLVIANRGLLIDLGRLHFRDFSNRPCTRYFHNIASFGIGGDVVKQTTSSGKLLAGLYLRSALLSLLRQGKKRIRLRVDDGYETETDVWNIAVANGRYHGGGMCIAPEATVDDGLFHVTVIGNLSPLQAFLHFPKLYDGRLRSIKQVLSFTGRQVEASSRQPVLLDVDGELPGCLPVRAEIVPHALFMIAEI
jgi:YegS/Rv2252/BmrU family lipid kinase